MQTTLTTDRRTATDCPSNTLTDAQFRKSLQGVPLVMWDVDPDEYDDIHEAMQEVARRAERRELL